MAGDQATHLIDGATLRSGALAAPRTIGGYRVVRPLGRGGMAVVYLAEHEVTGERVALKTVDSEDAGLRSSIRREIHALRRVDHPGVVRIVAEGIEGEQPWYAMEVVEGRSLREHPRFAGAAAGGLPRVLTLMRAICDPLAFVHGMGLVHRDLKPENIMIREDGSPVLVDFGLVRQIRGARGRDVLELGERYVGTPAYMAPEQINGELTDARVDLYALGCVMYEHVTGDAPFVGTADRVLRQHLHALPAPPSSRVKGVPPALDELILALLQKQPRDRIGYADDVAAALLRLGAEDRPPARRAEPHLYRSRLAGREGALAEIEERVENLYARGGRVLIGGESGVGKTRFAMEVGIVASRRGVAISTGECVAVDVADSDVRSASLDPLRPLLATLVDHCHEQGLVETERVFGPRGPALAVHEPSIGRLPGQDRYPRPSALPASAARARLNASLAGALAAFAAARPLVLVIEDLQWADEATMSFLQSLDEAFFARSSVLLLGTYRTEESSAALRALAGAAGVTHVELGRLDARAVRRMVSDMIAVPEPPARFLAFLVERSEGHPFFVAEYVRLAVQERMLSRDDAGKWQIQEGDERSPYEALPLPGELRALVMRRVAALGAAALAAARMAAVLGREMDAGVLAAAMSLDDSSHLEAVEELRARQIVDVERGRLRFAHDKLREIIHGEIGADERRRLHAAAGAAIEARYAGTPELPRFYAELVHHFTTAQDHEKAFEVLVSAGDAALDASAAVEALGFLRRAVALDDGRPSRGVPPLGQRARARLESQLGRAAYAVGLLPEAERLTRSALHRFRGEPPAGPPSTLGAVVHLAGQLVPQATLLLGPKRPAVTDASERERLSGAARAAERLTEIYFFQQDWVRGLGVALETVSLAGRLGVSRELVRGYAIIGFGLTTVRLPRLRALYEARAREAARELADPEGIGWVSMLLGASALIAGRWSEARASFGVALARGREAQDPLQIATCLVLLAQIESFTGRPESALELFERLGKEGSESGSRQTQIWALGGRALCALDAGHARESMALFEQRRALAEDYRNDPTEWITHGAVAEARLHAGEHEGARRAAEATLRHIEKLTVVGFQFYEGYTATGETLFALWERATAPRERAALAQRARRMCRSMDRYARLYAIGRPQALRLRGLLDALSGRPGRARRAFAASLAEAERLAMPFEQGLAHHELGRHGAPGDPARASHLDAARAIFAAHGQQWWLDRLSPAPGSPPPA